MTRGTLRFGTLFHNIPVFLLRICRCVVASGQTQPEFLVKAEYVLTYQSGHLHGMTGGTSGYAQ